MSIIVGTSRPQRRAQGAMFGYVVNPTLAQHNAAWKQARLAGGPYIEVWERRSYASVEMDLYNAGPIPPETEHLAAPMVEWASAVPARRSVALSTGPVLYGTTRATVERAHLLALTLGELWWGNGDGAARILNGGR